MIAGTFVPTIWVNVMVIWFMTLILYILLYFRVLKRILDIMEQTHSQEKSKLRSSPQKTEATLLRYPPYIMQ